LNHSVYITSPIPDDGTHFLNRSFDGIEKGRRKWQKWQKRLNVFAGQGAQKHQIEAQAPTIMPRPESGRRGACGGEPEIVI
jgi:hypothetical protein